ncbi:hypothetical protein BJF79_03875 [Actinomadura sp. CNU-125]|uniref:hypothetical protein n=1 Tax=Actinomadura sp. CNU-125 TaxID=1904961 RepID=UPI000969B22A|nr:hypothetical protein [Actinomadura sp. CNU-125]OLT13047.1 hypothetical protein BJF79_03875 [Actinomadura sp. CNU-125]
MTAHGTNARYNDGCRCTPCTTAHRDEQRHRNRMIAYGRWDPWIPADTVRAHVRVLMAQGVPFRRAAKEADVSYYTMERLLYGDSGGPPPKKIRKDTALRILAVHASPELVSDVASIDSAGTVRRLQALGCLGHPQADLAARLGVRPDHLGRIRRTGRVSAGVARKVRALYDELWKVRPEGKAADRARLAARRFGWAPPMAWDDDRIDDPKAKPAGVRTEAA